MWRLACCVGPSYGDWRVVLDRAMGTGALCSAVTRALVCLYQAVICVTCVLCCDKGSVVLSRETGPGVLC